MGSDGKENGQHQQEEEEEEGAIVEPMDDYDPENPSGDFTPDDPQYELQIFKAMGLPTGFDTSKGKKVEGNEWYSAKIKTVRDYRQYMNRKGGFNRKLDPDKNVERVEPLKKKPSSSSVTTGNTTSTKGISKDGGKGEKVRDKDREKDRDRDFDRDRERDKDKNKRR